MFPPSINGKMMPATTAGKSIADIIKASTENLRRSTATIATGGGGNISYLGFSGTEGHWTLNKEPITAEEVGRILVYRDTAFEGCVEWANGSSLQRVFRPIFTATPYTEDMGENLLQRPTSPGAYRKETDGPTLVMGFGGTMFDDGVNIKYEHSSNGGREAASDLNSASMQAMVAFGVGVNPVVELDSTSYESAYRKIFKPVFRVVGFITDERLAAASDFSELNDDDIVTRPKPTIARQKREAKEGPAL